MLYGAPQSTGTAENFATRCMLEEKAAEVNSDSSRVDEFLYILLDSFNLFN